jgi:hypothetical protein
MLCKGNGKETSRHNVHTTIASNAARETVGTNRAIIIQAINTQKPVPRHDMCPTVDHPRAMGGFAFGEAGYEI